MYKHIPESMRPTFERTAHPYLMWDGIRSIPNGIEDMLSARTQAALRSAAETINRQAPMYFVGCGTSYFSAIAGTYAYHRLCGIPAYAYNAFEFRAYPPPNLKGATLVAISHTGTTPEVLEAVTVARSEGALTIGFTDGAQSPLTKACDHAIFGAMGKEPALPKTRSYVAALMRHYSLALNLGQSSPKSKRPSSDALQDAPTLAERTLTQTAQTAEELAVELDSVERLVCAGGGPHFATALEGALKLTESAQVTTLAWEIEEAGHGAWASTNPGDWLLLLAFQGPSLQKAKKILAGMKAIDAHVWAITDQEGGLEGADLVTLLPGDLPEVFSPLTAILPIYQFTYELARIKGIHPDIMRLDDPRYYQARTVMRPSHA